MPTITFRPVPRGCGKERARIMADRYEAAIRLETIRQQLRECARYGFTVSNAMVHEHQDATREYNAATDALI